MGGCCSSSEKVEPTEPGKMEEINKQAANGHQTDFQGPVAERKCTDVFFLIILACFVISLFGLVGYCIQNGDIYRILNGYDKCGNTCGRNNNQEMPSNANCIVLDHSKRKFVEIKGVGSTPSSSTEQNLQRECVDSCPGDTQQILNRCIHVNPDSQTSSDGGKNKVSVFSRTGLRNFFQEVSEDLDVCWREILYMCLIALGFSILILILFRFLVGIVVWFVIITVIVVSIIGTIFLWVLYSQKMKEMKNNQDNDVEMRIEKSYLAYAIIATIATVIILLVILVLRKRIKLVIQLFKEAGKAIHSMPFLLLEPVITFVSLALAIALWLYFAIWIESAGFPLYQDNKDMRFVKNDTIRVTRWYNVFAMFWFTQFCIGCQHMIIAGAVCKWFFTRNKSNLGWPILESFRRLVRYHLGSVALGSLLIAILQIIRTMLAALESQFQKYDNKVCNFFLKCCQCCLWLFEKILKYLTRNAYIEIAMFGHNFCKAGQQAFKLLASNALRVAAINSVGDFVLFLGKAVVVICTVLCGIEMIKNKGGVQHVWVPLAIAGLFAYIVSHCFMTVYEMTIDTIFLCFCEDCERNDGLSRPYYMSRGLMEFVQNSRKALANLDSATSRGVAWGDDRDSSGQNKAAFTVEDENKKD